MAGSVFIATSPFNVHTMGLKELEQINVGPWVPGPSHDYLPVVTR